MPGTPLDPETVAAQRARLEARWHALRQRVANLDATLRRAQADALGELAVYDNHPADIGDELFERSKDWALRQRLAHQLERVEQALWRVDQGLYGVCARCGRPIELERLRALPEAEFCLDCQREVEEEEWPQPEARPVEEEVLQGPAARLHGFGQVRRVVFDEEDAFQAVERYGTSDSPQDLPGARDLDELAHHADEQVGVVQAVEGLVDERGEVLGGAPDELVAEARSDPEGDKALREGQSVRVTGRRALRRHPGAP